MNLNYLQMEDVFPAIKIKLWRRVIAIIIVLLFLDLYEIKTASTATIIELYIC